MTANYPGANATLVAQNVGAPIEQQVNGANNMIYMSSTSASTGNYTLSVFFTIDTDPELAQVDVQNRVSQAMAQLPQSVQSEGVDVAQKTSTFLMVLAVFSPDDSLGPDFISNYTNTQILSTINRINGANQAAILGALIGMLLVGFSINMLTLFGMILAIGLVVDDAIVVVENTERNMVQFGLTPNAAAKRAMDEVSGPAIAVVLVLNAVFVPVAFLSGITGALCKLAQIENGLSILLGRNPGPIPRGLTVQAMATPAVPAGVPSQLLARRPDILQAEQKLFPAELNLAATTASDLSALVSIYQSMGGGWIDEADRMAPAPVPGKGPFAPAIPNDNHRPIRPASSGQTKPTPCLETVSEMDEDRTPVRTVAWSRTPAWLIH